jgi:FkbH-like protein
MKEDLLSECRNIEAIRRDPVALHRLGRRVSKAIAAGRIGGPKIRVAVLASFLADMLVDVLPAALLARGIIADITNGPYGAIAVDLLSEDSITAACDLVMILPTHRDLAFAPKVGCSLAEADAAADAEAAHWIALWDRIKAPIVQLSFDPPPVRALSEADGFRPGGLLRHVRQVNQRISDAAGPRVALVDCEALVMTIGPDWHDPRTYLLCKQPFAPSSGWELADTIAAAASSLLGKDRKVLVLDLDNTLWGGVVGDVGVRGITIGRETAEGEAFAVFQEFVRNLAARGVILAVCSKGTDESAREPFREHPGMVLKEEDIACFVSNFEDKASNIQLIAKTLNVGLDALVFVDDNPVERAWVRQELPEVLVLDMPEEPALFCQAIERARAFPMHTLTQEDLGRNVSYRARALVRDAKVRVGDIGAFLQSLNAEAQREDVGAASIDRITQLIKRTNQFKLNASSFSARQLGENADGVFAIRLKDRLQDYGIVAVVVSETKGDEVIIHNWVMSCRVFSRRVEHATLELIRSLARQRGAHRIRAQFHPSAKNAVAKDALIDLGFTPAENSTFVAPVVAVPPSLPHFIRTEWQDNP